MKYVTGIHALNVACKLNTTGDWHTSAIDWKKLSWKDTETAFFGDYGIYESNIPYHKEKVLIADHIRAILDLICDRKFSIVQGMRDDYIANDDYTDLIFEKVYLLRNLEFFHEIDNFMEKEYKMRWLNWKSTKK